MDFTSKKNEYGLILNDYINGDPLDEENLTNSLRNVEKIRQENPKAVIWVYTKYWIATILRHPFRKRVVQRCNYIVDKTLWKESPIKHIWKNENNKWTNVTYEE